MRKRASSSTGLRLEPGLFKFARSVSFQTFLPSIYVLRSQVSPLGRGYPD